MLQTLHIRDFVIVDQAEINFNTGFTVFSGETGAGKSILIDALSLALGARANAGMIREGAPRTDITAIFSNNATAAMWLENNDLPIEDDIILRRTVDQQGRSRAFVNGTPSTIGQLRDLSQFLIDIHGQHAHQSLLNTSHQRALLDDQAQANSQLDQVSTAWDAWQNALKKLEMAHKGAAEREQQRSNINWRLDDINQLGLHNTEWHELNNNHSRLANSQALIQGCATAINALDNDEISAIKLLNQAKSEIQNLVRHDNSLDNVQASLESALIACTDAVSELNHYSSNLDLDPQALAQTEQRMAEIFDVARKLRVGPEDLYELKEQLTDQLAALDTASNIEQLEANVSKAQAEYEKHALKLSKTRHKAAKKLTQEVTAAMQTLAMEGGSFNIDLSPSTPGRYGTESIQFLVAGHAGATPRPLAQVASGGELARISLALAVTASQAAQVPALIFDEVDTGIGGRVAEVVGQHLQQLGKRHQVLCVTHLPQVAAKGTHHYEVSKVTKEGLTVSYIKPMNKQERINEIARMLGGINITDTTLQHATEMLKSTN